MKGLSGKIAVLTLIVAPVLVGGGIWYAQEYGFYDEIDPASPAAAVQMQTADGLITLTSTGFQGIDADSSPIRWRACFRIEGDIPAGRPYDGATPLYGPRWFDCFDARQIGHDLETGTAIAVLAESEIHADVDRVLAIYPDGRAYGWHQYNDKTPERGVME